MKYVVPIVFRGQDNFIVEAANPEEAAQLAIARFKAGDQPDEFGNEWHEIERVGTVEPLD